MAQQRVCLRMCECVVCVTVTDNESVNGAVGVCRCLPRLATNNLICNLITDCSLRLLTTYSSPTTTTITTTIRTATTKKYLSRAMTLFAINQRSPIPLNSHGEYIGWGNRQHFQTTSEATLRIPLGFSAILK